MSPALDAAAGTVARAGHDAEHPWSVDDGQRFGLVDQFGAGLAGGVDEMGVESTPGPDRAVIGEPASGRPGQLAPLRSGDHPESVDAMGTVEVDVQVLERTHGPGRETVAADLVAAVGGLLEHDHLGSGSCRTDGGGCAGRAGTDDGDVVALGRGGHPHSLAGRNRNRTVIARQPNLSPARCSPMTLDSGW